ncbi:hypothetical protein H9649_11305 [Sporosarcina sp. Sa2YVA2]|uniref:Uncharacterized protein n=1 Tax=Sporosarcina quadrami TaxID=2762234 RepID=A0ABR8UAW1_9BACL|nr:hypothetical protein [Sporosarcina quadrami]MBD7985177.1 hypothetical protein [Sporosarcina quadrami]
MIINDVDSEMNQRGAVTFLDVLGWKGIWKENPNAINSLLRLIIDAEDKAKEFTLNATELNPAFRGMNTEVISISDTIAIFTPGDPNIALKIHGQLCKYLIPESIRRSIPLRGATAFGNYSKQENIMIGPAIDESASWHESTNWIGVILSPSAIFELGEDVPSPWIKYHNIPFKKRISLKYCVEWTFEEEDILNHFKDMGPFVPEIAEKYINTHDFLTFIKELDKNQVIEKLNPTNWLVKIINKFFGFL